MSSLNVLTSFEQSLSHANATKAETICSVRNALQKLARRVQDFTQMPITESTFENLRNYQHDMLYIIDRAMTELIPQVAESPSEMKALVSNALDLETADALRQCLAAQDRCSKSLFRSMEQLSTDTHVACVDEARQELNSREPSLDPLGVEAHDDAGILKAFRIQAHASRRRSLEELIQKEKNRTHQLHGFIARHMKELVRNQFEKLTSQVSTMESQIEQVAMGASRDITSRTRRDDGAACAALDGEMQMIIKAQFQLIHNSLANLRSWLTNYAGVNVDELRQDVLGHLERLDRQAAAGLTFMRKTMVEAAESGRSSNGHAIETTSTRSGDAAAGSKQQVWAPDIAAEGLHSAEAVPPWEQDEATGLRFDTLPNREVLRSASPASPPSSRRSSRGLKRMPSQHQRPPRQSSGSPPGVPVSRADRAAERTPSPPAAGARQRADTRPWRGGGHLKHRASEHRGPDTPGRPARSRESSPGASSCTESVRDDQHGGSLKASPKRHIRDMRMTRDPQHPPRGTRAQREASPKRHAQSTPPRKQHPVMEKARKRGGIEFSREPSYEEADEYCTSEQNAATAPEAPASPVLRPARNMSHHSREPEARFASTNDDGGADHVSSELSPSGNLVGARKRGPPPPTPVSSLPPTPVGVSRTTHIPPQIAVPLMAAHEPMKCPSREPAKHAALQQGVGRHSHVPAPSRSAAYSGGVPVQMPTLRSSHPSGVRVFASRSCRMEDTSVNAANEQESASSGASLVFSAYGGSAKVVAGRPGGFENIHKQISPPGSTPVTACQADGLPEAYLPSGVASSPVQSSQHKQRTPQTQLMGLKRMVSSPCFATPSMQNPSSRSVPPACLKGSSPPRSLSPAASPIVVPRRTTAAPSPASGVIFARST